MRLTTDTKPSKIPERSGDLQAPYYKEHEHIKSLYKQVAAPITFIALIIVATMNMDSMRLPFHVWLAVLIVSGWLIYREVWRYQNWYRIFDGNGTAMLYRPGRLLLGILNKTTTSIPLNEAVIGKDSGQNLWEQAIFRKSSTLTVDTPSDHDDAFHGMGDVLDAERIVKIINYVRGAPARHQASLKALHTENNRLQRENGHYLDVIARQLGWSPGDTQEMPPVSAQPDE